MDNVDVFMNTIVFLAGAYLIYSAIIMKTRGEVGSALLSRDINWNMVSQDKKDAYIKAMIPANIVMGIVMLVLGALFTFEDRLGITGAGDIVLLAVSLVAVMAYGALLMRYQSKYLR